MEEEPEHELRAVVHILVVGFHHQRGAEVDYVYPEFKNVNLNKHLPVPWLHLLHLALPDGVHNYDGDYTFFLLPKLTKQNMEKHGVLYGVACFQQISSKELKVKTDDVTRTTVQKSIVILLQKPLFGYILTKLNLVTQAYFNERDFSRTGILKDTYIALNQSLSAMDPSPSLYFTGLSVGDLILLLKQKVILLAKLLLLEKKVVFWGSPVGHVCCTLLSILSLYPGFFQYNALGGVSSEIKGHPIENSSSKKDHYGLPLDLFGEDYVLHPYLSMQQMNDVKAENIKGFVIGSSNMLFKHQSHVSWDVLVDLEKNEVIIPDNDLAQELILSTEDLRFADFLVSSVVEYQKESKIGWDGSDDWIRLQFKYYILCLLASTAPEKGSSNHIHKQFNDGFISSWIKTKCYEKWCRNEHLGLDDIHQGHPFEGSLTISDVKLRIKSKIDSLSMTKESKEKIGAAVQKTSQVVGEALSSAKNAITSWRSWFSGIVEEINEEMQGNSMNVEFAVKNSNSRELDSNSEELEHGMLIREEKGKPKPS